MSEVYCAVGDLAGNVRVIDKYRPLMTTSYGVGGRLAGVKGAWGGDAATGAQSLL